MSVIHILKDGSRVDDITGHVVKMEDAEQLYALLSKINRRGSKTQKQKIHTNECKTR